MIERADAAIAKRKAARRSPAGESQADFDSRMFKELDEFGEKETAKRIKATDQALRSLQDTRLRIAALQAGDDVRAKARVDVMRIELDLQRKITAIKASDLTVSQQAMQIQALQAEARIRRTQTLAAAEQRLAQVKAQSDAEEMARVNQLAAARQAAAQQSIRSAFEVANAGIQAAGALGASQRVLAGIQAGIATGEGLLAVARYDFGAAASAFAAAIAFGAQAFAKPSTPTATTPSGPVGGGISGPAPSSGGGAAPVFNIVLNGVMTTRAEVGAAIDKATKAAQMAGMAGA
jgi:hypothetical protein